LTNKKLTSGRNRTLETMQEIWVSVEGLAKEQKKLQHELNELIQQWEPKTQVENFEKQKELREKQKKLVEDFLYEDVDLLLSSARASAQPSVTQKSQSTLRTQDIKRAVTLEFSRMLRQIEVAQEGLKMPQVILLLTSSVGLEIALLRR
jgi:hypothetical protein